MKRTPLKRKTRLKRKKPLSKRAKKQKNPYSSYWKNQAVEAFMAQYRGKPCEVCRTLGVHNRYMTCAHHLIAQGRASKYKCEPMNVIVLCPAHHKWDQHLAAHSDNPLAVERFLRWMETHKPEQTAWWLEHEHDKTIAKINWKELCDFLTNTGAS